MQSYIETETPATHVTLRRAWQEYQKHRKLRETTIRHYNSRIHNQFADWVDKPLIHITEDDIATRHAYVTQHNGPAIANSAMRTLRAIIRFAQFKYRRADRSLLIQVNPVQQMNELKAWNKDKRRQRIVSPGQMCDWYRGVMSLHSAVSRDLLLLLMFTGMRWEEASEATWKEVDLGQGLLRLPAERTKTDKARDIPLSDFTWRLLMTREQSAISPWVFPNMSYSGPITSASKACYYVRCHSGVPFSPHDLRRSFATVADDIEVPKDVRQRLLGHVASDVHDDYVIASPERLRRVTQRITNAMLTYMGVVK